MHKTAGTELCTCICYNFNLKKKQQQKKKTLLFEHTVRSEKYHVYKWHERILPLRETLSTVNILEKKNKQKAAEKAMTFHL